MNVGDLIKYLETIPKGASVKVVFYESDGYAHNVEYDGIEKEDAYYYNKAQNILILGDIK